MKIGILTFWTGQDNYGQIAQCYALQSVLRRMGHEPFIVRCRPQSTLKNRLAQFVRMLKSPSARERRKNWNAIVRPGARRFREFLEERCVFSAETFDSFSALKKNCPEADAFIVGSDQVWNCNADVNGRIWFLDFVPAESKKIAYAASFGKIRAYAAFKAFCREKLASFDTIGVREQEGTDFCRKMGRSDAVLVCDPTLLLRKEDYCALIPDNAGTQEKKPLLCYMLGHACAFPKDVLDAFVAEKGLELHYVPSQGAENLGYYAKVETPTVQGWLRLYRDAEYVVTNSFHGTVFAILMQKKFLALPLSGKSSGMNGRLESLLTELDLRERLLTGSGNGFRRVMDAPIDWESVSARAEILRKQGKEFLKQL